MTQDEIAVDAINAAADAVHDLRNQVDPGHVPMLESLKRLERKLRRQARELSELCERESGG